MESALQIAMAITKIVSQSKPRCSRWKIGITNKPEGLKKSRGYPPLWSQWGADSLNDAETVKEYFVSEKGMQGEPEERLTKRRVFYVYIF